jgi:hypothetical protein
MKENIIPILYDFDCGICGKHTPDKRYPVIYKFTNETILVCETCLSFIIDPGEYSSYKVVKK